MEHFLLEEPVLQSLAHLSDSAKPFPTELVQKLREQRCAEKEQTMTQRAFLGQLELEMFLDGSESLVALQRRLAEQYVPHRLPDKSALGPLLEIMVDNANEKHMCRYRYLWSEVMGADIYSLFQEVGVENQDKMRELGLRLRKIMIEPGGLLDGQAAFREFRGRDMSPEAMFAMFNAKNSTSTKD
jgi:oligopeptidase A